MICYFKVGASEIVNNSQVTSLAYPCGCDREIRSLWRYLQKSSKMRNKALLVLTLVALCVTHAIPKPSPCLDNSNCRDKYFCDLNLHECHKCLKCEDLKREPLLSSSACVTTFGECGQCLEGLVTDPQGGLSCVKKADEIPMASDNYLIFWVILGLFIVGFFSVAAILIFKYVSKQNFFRVNVDTNIGATLPAVASAPEPPPYYVHTNPMDIPTEDAHLIKQYQPPEPKFTSLENQETQPFSPPSYVRYPPTQEYRDVNSFEPVDDDTEPSPWRPADSEHNNNNTINPHEGVDANTALPGRRHSEAPEVSLSAALVAARNTDLIRTGVASPPIQMQSLSGPSDESDDDYSETRNTQYTEPRNGYNVNINLMNIITQGATVNNQQRI